MRTLDQVRALFEDGAVVECVENTYRPELNGTRRRIDKLGKSYADCTPLDGPDAGKSCGFRMALPTRARDVLAVSADAVTFRLGRDDHTVTLRREAERPDGHPLTERLRECLRAEDNGGPVDDTDEAIAAIEGALCEGGGPRCLQVRSAFEGETALVRATESQRSAYRRLAGRCSIRGVLWLDNGHLQVGFESADGRDREAVIDLEGRRVSTRNTYEH